MVLTATSGKFPKTMKQLSLCVISLLCVMPISFPAAAKTNPGATNEIKQRQQMSDTIFWSIIDKTIVAKSDPESQLRALTAQLMKLSEDEIVAFHEAFTRQIDKAYTWRLWGAAYIANGGASDDGFEYFRRWLISQGSLVFKQLVEQPDDLGDFVSKNQEEPLEFEEFGNVAIEVWVERSGRNFDDFPMPLVPAIPMGSEPSGTRFDDSPEFFARNYPKLWRRFGEAPLG
jgi:hypothetical protein